MELLFILILIVVGVFTIFHLINQARRKSLMEKYGDEHVVDMIMRKTIWQGMSTEQLRDALGSPSAIDRKVYKSKTRETYKYAQAGKNRFRQRVTVENNVVVGWDLK